MLSVISEAFHQTFFFLQGQQPDIAEAIFSGLSGGAGGNFEQLKFLLEGDEQVMEELAKLSQLGTEAGSTLRVTDVEFKRCFIGCFIFT